MTSVVSVVCAPLTWSSCFPKSVFSALWVICYHKDQEHRETLLKKPAYRSVKGYFRNNLLTCYTLVWLGDTLWWPSVWVSKPSLAYCMKLQICLFGKTRKQVQKWQVKESQEFLYTVSCMHHTMQPLNRTFIMNCPDMAKSGSQLSLFICNQTEKNVPLSLCYSIQLF